MSQILEDRVLKQIEMNQILSEDRTIKHLKKLEKMEEEKIKERITPLRKQLKQNSFDSCNLQTLIKPTYLDNPLFLPECGANDKDKKAKLIKMTMNKTDLKPCPFCGSDVHWEFYVHDPIDKIRITCSECRYYLTIVYFPKGDDISNSEILELTEQAVKKWNTRKG